MTTVDNAVAHEDEAVLAGRAQRDPAAFAPLYERYLDPVYRYCYRRLGSREAAEDATSQVFSNALAALPGFRRGSFRAWLFTIANNVVTDVYRRRRPTQPLDGVPEPVDQTRTPEERAVAADESRNLRAVMGRLTADQQQVLELRLAGLTGAEIAAVLGRDVAAVKMLQLRAMRRLRVLLAVDGQATGADDGS
jgi:RNA polymerase sigma-70 factor (ECF subfamily)